MTITIDQNIKGYRYSIEPFLLASFAALKTGDHLLDIGTGCGIIPLLLTGREPDLRVVAVEIQKPLYDAALRNIARNGLPDRIQLILGDFAEVAPRLEAEGFDLIISNPPFRKKNTGRINPNPVKAVARHEIHLDLPSLAYHSARLLKPGASLVLAYPPTRLPEVLRELERCELKPGRLRFVHGYRGAEAKIFLVEAVKERRTDCVVEDPLYVYNPDGTYTHEMERIYASFDHSCRPDHLAKK